jgi:hypothetical protein
MGKYLQEVFGMIHEVLREEDEKKRGREREEGLTRENLVELLS